MMKDFEKLKLLFETMPFDELEQRIKKISADIHERQTALDKEKNDLDIICGIYVRRIELDKEFKEAVKSTMKSL